MNRKLTDEQLDQMMQRITLDGSLDQETVNEVADSPQLWWAIRRNIAEQNDDRVSAWPPPAKWRKWFAIGVPAIAAIMLAIGFMAISNVEMIPENVSNDRSVNSTRVTEDREVDDERIAVSRDQDKNTSKTTSEAIEPKAMVRRSTQKIKGNGRRPNEMKDKLVKSSTAEEVKTEFIALSYGRDPESGQIVRVKVPSSMMVTLGLVSAVQNATSMIDADVVIGDDGMTHAIRFIR